MDEVRTPHGHLVLGPGARVRTLTSAGAEARAGDGVAADLVNAVLGASGRTDDDDAAPSIGPAVLRADPGRVHALRPDRPGPGAGVAGAGRALTGADERDFGVDMTNWSVAVGDAVVKVVHTWGSADRAALILDHLASIGSTATPALLGRLDWEHPAGRSTLALVTELIPGATDGWTWAVDDVLAHLDGGPAPQWPQHLGVLTARLHTDLARMPHGPPARGEEVRTRAGATLGEALAVTGGQPGRRLRDRRPALQRALDSIPDDLAGPSIHLHGDLHVGQVLRAGGQYWVIDFDGDPQLPADRRNRPDTATRDVAHLLTSVELVASVCARRRNTDPDAETALRTWAAAARADLLAAYQGELATQGNSELLDARALEGLIVEQLLRELTYAATYLPRWQYAADTALTFRYPAG